MRFFETQNTGTNKWANFLRKTWNHKLSRIFLGGLIGAGIGWAYWEIIGCNSGSCPLTSSAPKSIIIFAIFGMWFNYRK